MQIDTSTGLLMGADFIPSPNFDDRPSGDDINLLVIHNISLPMGEFHTQRIIDLFTNQLDFEAHPSFAELADLQVSSHLLVTRNAAVIQFVPLHLRAWHAGVSSFQGRERCNDFSIGIELEGTDDVPYEKSQYQTLAQLTNLLMQTYAIPRDHIVGHCDIAPKRKTDPGPAFNWQHFQQLLHF